MKSYRFYTTIFSFCLLSVLIFYVAFFHKKYVPLNLDQTKKSLKDEQFTTVVNAHYFSSHRNKPKIELISSRGDILNGTQYFFNEPKGKVYTQAQKEIHYSGLKGSLNQENHSILLAGKAHIQTIEAEHKSDETEYFFKRDDWKANGNIESFYADLKSGDKIRIYSHLLTGKPRENYFVYDGKVHGVIERQKAYEGKMKFETDHLVINLPQSMIEMENNVYLERQNNQARSRKAEIFLENFNKKLKYYVLSDDVRLKEFLKDGGIREAFAEKLEGHNENGGIIILSGGYPRVVQEKDVVKGHKITLYKQSDLVEIEDSTSRIQLEKDRKKQK